MILVTGGEGYIGSHIVKQLLDRGEEVVTIDNFSTHENNVNFHFNLHFNCFDMKYKRQIKMIFDHYDITEVIHLAGLSSVEESIKEPIKYYQNNVISTINLLEIMENHNVDKIVFSSSASVYGNVDYLNSLYTIPITEKEKPKPINPYGETKLIIENMIKYQPNLKYVGFRYFNVAGALDNGDLGEHRKNETHLIPLLLKAIKNDAVFTIFGDNYNTKDGTCIRDYVSVIDIARAHILALDYLRKDNKSEIFNLGTKNGYSVKEIVENASKVLKKDVKIKIGEPRKGDSYYLVANADKAKKILGWTPQYDLNQIIKSTWNSLNW